MSGYITQEMSSSRILSVGKIESLPFDLKQIPFSLFLHSKPDTPYKAVVILECTLYADKNLKACPFNTNGWTSTSISSISESDFNLLIFEEFDLYWGAGCEVIL